MIILNNKQYGVSVIKLLFLIPVTLIGLVVLFYVYTEMNKAYWDYQVKQMCEKDGGVNVYKKTLIKEIESASIPHINGAISIPPKPLWKEGLPFFTEDEDEKLKESNPSIRRSKRIVKLAGTGEIVGVIVSYHRVGGDFPLIISHHSSFRCPSSREIYSSQSKFYSIDGAK